MAKVDSQGGVNTTAKLDVDSLIKDGAFEVAIEQLAVEKKEYIQQLLIDEETKLKKQTEEAKYLRECINELESYKVDIDAKTKIPSMDYKFELRRKYNNALSYYKAKNKEYHSLSDGMWLKQIVHVISNNTIYPNLGDDIKKVAGAYHEMQEAKAIMNEAKKEMEAGGKVPNEWAATLKSYGVDIPEDKTVSGGDIMGWDSKAQMKLQNLNDEIQTTMATIKAIKEKDDKTSQRVAKVLEKKASTDQEAFDV